MATNVTLVEPSRLFPNPENPRLIFREDELRALEDSIRSQGILVPLTVYQDGRRVIILDGERRWRCAMKIGLGKVPVILQPKPEPLANLMMMFAIHHRRQEWDPLPTALKMQELERLYKKQYGRLPNEKELAELGSLTRGEVRRYRKLLAIPKEYRDRLLTELSKPRQSQRLTVDHVLESFAAASILRRRNVLESEREEIDLRDALIRKFEGGKIDSTVAPRRLARMSKAVAEGVLDRRRARRVIERIISDDSYGIDEAVSETLAGVELDSAIQSSATRLVERLDELIEKSLPLSEASNLALKSLQAAIRRSLRG